jgi:hypothetical protein
MKIFISKNIGVECWQVWWRMPIIPALEQLREEDLNFKASLRYVEKPCLKKNVEYLQIETTLHWR